MTSEEVKAGFNRYTAHRVLTDSTLMGYNKSQLVSFIRVLEHNWAVAEDSLRQQAENVKDWEPVKHGHWIYGGMLYVCSYCGVETPSEPFGVGYRYCPHCGAKMDEEEV